MALLSSTKAVMVFFLIHLYYYFVHLLIYGIIVYYPLILNIFVPFSIINTEIYIFIILFILMCIIYFIIAINIYDVQNNFYEKHPTSSNINKIIKIYCYIYSKIFFSSLILVSVIYPDTSFVFLQYQYTFMVIYEYIFYKLKYQIYNIVSVTKIKTYYYYLMFYFFQVGFYIIMYIFIYNYFLILLITFFIIVGNIYMTNYILTFQILDVRRIFAFAIVFTFCKFMEFSLLSFFINNIDYTFMNWLGNIFDCNKIIIEDIISMFVSYVSVHINVLSRISMETTIRYYEMYFNILSKIGLRIISLLISWLLILVDMFCGILQKVKLTGKVIDVIKHIIYFSIYSLNNNIVLMNYGDPPQGGYYGGNIGSGSSGGGNYGGGNFGGNPNNMSTLNLHPLNYNLNKLTAPLTPDRRLINRTSWYLPQPEGPVVPGYLAYSNNHNAFYIIPNRDSISYRRFTGSDYVHLKYIKLHLILMKRLIYEGTVRPNEFVLVPIHLVNELPHIELHPNSISRGIVPVNWGISKHNYNNFYNCLTINIKEYNYIYDFDGNNPTLDNIRLGLEDYRNKGGRLNNTTFDHKIQIYLLQFLQDKRGDLFDKLMRKDPLNRLIAPTWSNLKADELLSTIAVARFCETEASNPSIWSMG